MPEPPADLNLRVSAKLQQPDTIVPTLITVRSWQKIQFIVLCGYKKQKRIDFFGRQLQERIFTWKQIADQNTDMHSIFLWKYCG